MGRPHLGRSGRTITASVKISPLEAATLVEKSGSVSAGLRALLDGGAMPTTPKRCRIHKVWSDPNITVAYGMRTTTKTCIECGYASITNTPV